MAEPIVTLPPLMREERWQAPSVDATIVQRTLDRLWSEIGQERRTLLGRPRSSADGMTVRTRTLNLVVVADTPEQVEQVKETVLGLTEFFPSRTVILVRTPSRHTHDGLDVTVAAEEHTIPWSKSTIRFETIVVSSGGGPEEMLASVASPILVPELPAFVMYPSGTFADSRLFEELIDTADRMVVDSSTVTDPSRALRFLADLHRQSGEAIKLSDVTWRRLTPWRQMVAQFFDIAANQPCLEAIETVRITYAQRDESGRSGLSSALLMAGWLCTRLGWRAPGEELVRSRDGWKLTLRAGEKGRSREVVLTLDPTADPYAGACLGGIELTSSGNAPGLFTIQRVSAEGITTTSEAPVMMHRTIYAKPPDDRRLLSHELREFGVDPIYTESLRFAAMLWPEGVEG